MNATNNISNESMSKEMSKIMTLAWQFVKQNGFTMSEALCTAWANYRFEQAAKVGIVEFGFLKVDGVTMRQAFGTICTDLIPQDAISGGERKVNPMTHRVYWDTEKQAFRCFKRCNLRYVKPNKTTKVKRVA